MSWKRKGFIKEALSSEKVGTTVLSRTSEASKELIKCRFLNLLIMEYYRCLVF